MSLGCRRVHSHCLAYRPGPVCLKAASREEYRGRPTHASEGRSWRLLRGMGYAEREARQHWGVDISASRTVNRNYGEGGW
jgi:hypothetical protein